MCVHGFGFGFGFGHGYKWVWDCVVRSPNNSVTEQKQNDFLHPNQSIATILAYYTQRFDCKFVGKHELGSTS